MAYKVFVDGSAGTTGLKIFDRLRKRADVELLAIAPEQRKDLHARASLINQSDVTFLCLPDEAAREIVPLVREQVRLLDTSTAHRVHPDWTYGLPEVVGADKIRSANRVAVPGCHATGFNVIAAPLVQLEIVPADYPFCAHSVTGYSGGGKKMIAAYEAEERPAEYGSPRQYALGQLHKHLPEMQAVSGLQYAPVLNPIVADFYCGMAVTVPLHTRLLPKAVTPQDVAERLQAYYKDQPFITVHPYGVQPADGTIAANTYQGRDDLELFVCGREEQIIVVSRFDNLGKGSSGAAVQCMNIMLQLPAETGLTVSEDVKDD